MGSRILFSFLFCFLVLGKSQAQDQSIQFVEQLTYKSPELNQRYIDYKVYSTNLKSLREHLPNRNSSIQLSFGNDLQIKAQFSPSYIVDDAIKIEAITTEGIKLLEASSLPLTFKAFSDQGLLRLTINDNYIGGFISFSDKKLFIEMISSDDDEIYFALVDNQNYDNVIGTDCAHHASSDVSNKEKNLERVSGNCYNLDLAIAADHSMYEKHGNVQNVTNHIVNIMNIVAGNYALDGSTNFDDGVEFNISEIMVSTCAQCDLWTSTNDIFEVLSDFTAWAKADGFTASHQMGQFWTDRDYDGNYVGLADNSDDLFCQSGAYHVLQDYTTSTGFLSTMTAHEIGHNFGATHMSSTGFIMSSTLNNTDVWSVASQVDISASIDTQGSACLASCSSSTCSAVSGVVISNITSVDFDVSWDGDFGSTYKVNLIDLYTDQSIYEVTTSSSSLHISDSDYRVCKKYSLQVNKVCGSETGPIASVIFYSPMDQGCADFEADLNVNWTSGTVNFTDNSMNATSWNWDFGDGTTSTAQNPSHTYQTPGIYMVKLMVNNGAHIMELDSLVSVLPDRSLPYQLSNGGSFDVSTADFAPMGLDGTESIWELGIATGPLSSSDKVWKTKLSEDIGPINTESALYTPRFDFSSTADYSLEFEQSMEALYCNGPYALRLEYSIDNGSSWTRLGSHGDSGASASSWYNRGPNAACPISTSLFDDQTGWTFNASNVFSSYDVSFLSGNAQVIFRFIFAVDPGFSGGYNGDGSMINNFRITSSGVVALDLLNFNGTAHNDYNLLNWEIANLENFDSFIIEKSSVGEYFVEIGKIKGDAEISEYLFRDENFNFPVSYYRLKMLDLDGSVKYSDVVKVENTSQPKEIKVFPNPLIGTELSIQTEVSYDAIQIISTTGKVIFESKSQKTFSVHDIPSGIYLLALSQNHSVVYQQKIIIL